MHDSECVDVAIAARFDEVQLNARASNANGAWRVLKRRAVGTLLKEKTA